MVEVVKPLILSVEFVAHVAKGIFGAPVVAPDTLYALPSKNFNVARDPVTPVLPANALLITPVPATVITLVIPPVELKILPAAPPMFNVPAIKPMLPVPENAIATAFVALFKFKELPASITKSSPGTPLIVIVLVVAILDCNVKFVLLLTTNWPIVKLATSTLIVVEPPGTIPSPSTIKASESATTVLVVPVLSAAVFQFAGVFQLPPVVPTQ